MSDSDAVPTWRVVLTRQRGPELGVANHKSLFAAVKAPGAGLTKRRPVQAGIPPGAVARDHRPTGARARSDAAV